MSSTKKNQHRIGFIRSSENRVSVVAAALMGGTFTMQPQHHLLVNVDVSNVLATFSVILSRRACSSDLY